MDAGGEEFRGPAGPPAPPERPRNKTAAKWARKVASRQRRRAARSEQPDPWDGLQAGEPTPQPAEEPAPAGGAECQDPPLVTAPAPSHEADPPEDLAAHIARDAALFWELGWRGFVEQRRTATDFASLENVDQLPGASCNTTRRGVRPSR